MSEELIGKDVLLDNPNGYGGYAGVITGADYVGKEWWMKVDWETPYHPCISPILLTDLVLTDQ